MPLQIDITSETNIEYAIKVGPVFLKELSFGDVQFVRHLGQATKFDSFFVIEELKSLGFTDIKIIQIRKKIVEDIAQFDLEECKDNFRRHDTEGLETR